MSFSQPTRGVVCAIWTPLNSAGGIAFDLLDRHLDWLATMELSGLMALGSTGRFPFLPPELREQFLRHLLPRCAGSLPVIANISDLE
ncbi:MAG TPA: hypothetical protein DCY13_13950, partial [Verrucomicrobiales bacterium]|nr:hypothetical protein [Verrucomicrobiales bacterium]